MVYQNSAVVPRVSHEAVNVGEGVGEELSDLTVVTLYTSRDLNGYSKIRFPIEDWNLQFHH